MDGLEGYKTLGTTRERKREREQERERERKREREAFHTFIVNQNSPDILGGICMCEPNCPNPTPRS